MAGRFWPAIPSQALSSPKPVCIRMSRRWSMWRRARRTRERTTRRGQKQSRRHRRPPGLSSTAMKDVSARLRSCAISRATCRKKAKVLYAVQEEADRKQCPRRFRRSPRRLRSRLRLSQRQPGVVEKGLAGGGQLDAAHAAADQLDANLVFEIADLAAEGRLGGVQPFLSRQRQAALLGNRDEIAKVP